MSAATQTRGAALTEPWVSVDDVAAHLGVAKDSVYRWIEAKHMPAHKIGKLWKFKLTEIDEWVRAGGANEPVPKRLLRAPRRKSGAKG
jgi:excisionase family DNA binding protein